MYQLTVTDGGGLTDTTYLTVSIRYPAGRPSLGLTRRISLGLQPGQTLSRVLPAATGGDGALTYRLTPARAGVMAFDAATRTVTFTPAAAGTWNFDYTVTDADGDADTIKVSLRAAASAAPRFAAGASIRDLRLLTGRDVGPVTATVPLAPLPPATGGDGDLAYTLEPAVPGLSLDPRTRRITGTPTTAGTYAMTYRAVDSDADTGDADSAALSFTLEVAANSAPVALFAGQIVDVSVKIPGPEWGLFRHFYPYGIDLRGYFYDADGDELRFRTANLHSGVSFTNCTNYRYDHCVFPTREGAIGHHFSFEAVDPSGAVALQSFRLKGLPANRAPVVTSKAARAAHKYFSIHLPDVRNGVVIGKCAYQATGVAMGYEKRFVGAPAYFRDPDGDRLTYSARSSDARTRVELKAGPLSGFESFSGDEYVDDYGRVPHLRYTQYNNHLSENWNSTVTVTASDPQGLSASMDIPVRVANRIPDVPGCDGPPNPTFGGATIADQSWPANKAITPLTLPEQRGGSPPITYSLTPAVPGLTFDAETRTLSGTPTTVASATAMSYVVTTQGPRAASLGFTITITGADTAGTSPPTSAPLSVTIDEDTAHTFAADQFAFSDADADEYLYQLQVDTLPASGTLLLNDVEQAAGATIARADLDALVYRPPADWHGSTSFTFKVVDTTQRASTAAYHAYLTVTPVGDAPTSADFERTVAEDTALTFASTDFAFFDADGHADARGAVVIASLPAAAAGTLTLNGTAVTAGQSIPAPEDSMGGTLQFTPAANWNGAATFHFGVEDSSGLASLASNTATIRVTAVNDAPATADLGRSMHEDTTLELALADFAFTDADADDRLKAIVFTQAPQSGTPAQPAGTLSSFHGSVEAVIGNGDTVAAAGLTRLAYRPPADFSGRVTFTFQVVDQAGAVSAAASGVVRVAPVDDAPASEAFTIDGTEDEDVTLAAANFVFRDADAGDSLKAVQVVALPDAGHGVLALSGSAVKADQAIAAGDLGGLTFTPAADWFGNARFTFRVVDQSGARSEAAYAATITIRGVNDDPTAADFTRKWVNDLDFRAAFESVFADADPDDRLGAIELEEKPAGGTLRHEGRVQQKDTVIEASLLGDVVFEPRADTYRATIDFRVQDRSRAASQDTYTLSLWWNTPPSAQELARSTREDTPLPLAPADFDGVFTDTDAGDRLTAVTFAAPPPAAQGALTLDGAAVGAGQVIDRARLVGLAFTPAPDWNGGARFSFRVRDREAAESRTATATVTVTGVADAPVAAVLALSTPEDTALAFTAADFDGVFSDPDPGDGLTAVRVVSLPAAKHGVLALDGNPVTANQVVKRHDLGRLTFKPAAGWNGTATFDFKVVDRTDTESRAAAAQVTVITAGGRAGGGSVVREHAGEHGAGVHAGALQGGVQ